MNKIKSTIIAALFALAAITVNASCPDAPQTCMYRISGLGATPSTYYVICTNNINHGFVWGDGEHTVCRYDWVYAAHPINTGTTRLKAIQYTSNATCNCPPDNPVVQSCNVSDTRYCQYFNTYTYWHWDSYCGMCSQSCCGAPCVNSIILWNTVSGGDQ